MRLFAIAAITLLCAAPLVAQSNPTRPAPKKAQTEKAALAWQTDEDAAFKLATEQKKQVFIYFWHGGG